MLSPDSCRLVQPAVEGGRAAIYKAVGMFRLDGKIALVTGGSRGIGRACSEALGQQGARVIVNYLRGESAAREVADAISSRGGAADICAFDVTDTGAVNSAVEGLVDRHGRVDILVANAGIVVDGLLLRLKDEDADRMWVANVRGAIACARAVSRTMIRKRWGRIIFTSSVVGEMGNAGQTAYAATKAALVGATKSIARELASRGVTVNAIAPGLIKTEMTAALSAEQREDFVKLIPVGRIGDPSEVGAACVYLTSEEAAYVTGHVLRINGGMYV
jgi:3-oxoacyl-[acyl-carrier protein] reductase